MLFWPLSRLVFEMELSEPAKRNKEDLHLLHFIATKVHGAIDTIICHDHWGHRVKIGRGEMVPNVSALAEEYGIQRSLMRKRLDRLEKRGLIAFRLSSWGVRILRIKLPLRDYLQLDNASLVGHWSDLSDIPLYHFRTWLQMCVVAPRRYKRVSNGDGVVHLHPGQMRYDERRLASEYGVSIQRLRAMTQELLARNEVYFEEPLPGLRVLCMNHLCRYDRKRGRVPVEIPPARTIEVPCNTPEPSDRDRFRPSYTGIQVQAYRGESSAEREEGCSPPDSPDCVRSSFDAAVEKEKQALLEELPELGEEVAEIAARLWVRGEEAMRECEDEDNGN